MNVINKHLLLLTLFVFVSLNVFGWGMTGHRVVAEIAENHLNRKARKEISKLIGKQKLAYWANWPDFIKSDPNPDYKPTRSWHYINSEGNQSKEDFFILLENSSDENLYKAYLHVKEKLKDKNLGMEERQKYLYFVVHLIGDAHQPMHVGRPADLGGNKVEVYWFGRKTNLHKVWDSSIIDSERYSFTEYAAVLDIHPRPINLHYQQGDLRDWLYESHGLADEIYRDVAQNANLSYKYIYRFKYEMEACLLKAGLRLAKELNEIFS